MFAITAIFRASLLSLLLLLGHVFAAEATGLQPDDVAVDYRDGTYVASLVFSVAATPAVAIDVLTDFDHMVGIVPNLESSEIVSRHNNVFVVRQRGKANFGPFSFPFESQRRVELHADGRILSRALGGTTKHMHSEMRVQAEGKGSHLDYRIELVPDRWMPSSIGVLFMRHELAEQFSALLREMLRRQNGGKGE